MLGSFFFAERTVTAMAYLVMLQLYLLPQLEVHQPDVVFQQDGAPQHLAHIAREFLDMGAGLGVMDQFRSLRAHPILRRLIYFCVHTLRTLFTRSLTSLDELKLTTVAAIERVTPQMLENTWSELNTVWTSYLPRKGRMFKLFGILQY
jgi:hypothetical protein